MATATSRRVAPVFVTTDLARALAHYARLGFAVEAYDGGDFYGYARRDGIEIHLATVADIDLRTTTWCTYVWVDDAPAPYDEWSAAEVEGRLVPPTPTDYGIDEGAHVDPDGNLIRFGSSSGAPG
jgi:catechol 2,3-dioxygenase-like lactoylglutathione lyase family enzyme